MNLFRTQSKVGASTVTGESPCTTSDCFDSSNKNESNVSGVCKATDESGNENVDMNCAEGYIKDDVIFRDSIEEQNCLHDLQEGDHIVRWIMLAYCYPVQVHGIVLSVGPELVTIVDCGLTAVKADKAGIFDEDEKISSRYTKTRRRMNVLTLVDMKEIKKWKKIHYGKEYQLRMQSIKNEEGLQVSHKSGAEELHPSPDYESNSTPATGKTQIEDDDNLEQSEEPTLKEKQLKSFSFWPFCSLRSSHSNLLKQAERSEPQNIISDSTKATSQQQLGNEVASSSDRPTFRLPKSDPPALVLARLRFLLEHADRDDDITLPPHHIFYANSECIAVWIKTGHWSTLQASVFLHSSTVGNIKQTATLAIYLSSQTVTIPAAGIWGFFGGTTTISLFSAQPWIMPALVGGGMVYAGLPTMVLWRAKSRWLETEKNLNVAFWERVDSSVIVSLIQTWSGLKD